MSWERVAADYRRMAKPRAVEEAGDNYLIRPLGVLIVQALRGTPLPPTMVSVLAVLAGWWSAWLYFESNRRGMVPALAAGNGRERVPALGKGKKISAADIYRIYFHGPAYQLVDSAWKSGDEIVGQLAAPLPANHEPADLPLLAAPRLVELCFQTAGLAELAQEARMGLPSGVGRIPFHH